MADPSKFLHTWRLTPQSPFIRIYKFGWDADTDSLSFCKLFWGVVFSWLGVIMRAIIAVGDHYMTASHWQDKPTKPIKVKKGPSAPERMLDRITTFFDHVSSGWQRMTNTLAKTPKWLVDILVGIAIALVWVGMISAVLAVIGFVMFCFVAWTTGSLLVLELIGLAVGGALVLGVVGIAGGLGIGRVVVKTGMDKKAGPFFNKVWQGIKSVAHFVAAGYYVVKYRTCPRVLVIDEPSS